MKVNIIIIIIIIIINIIFYLRHLLPESQRAN